MNARSNQGLAEILAKALRATGQGEDVFPALCAAHGNPKPAPNEKPVKFVSPPLGLDAK